MRKLFTALFMLLAISSFTVERQFVLFEFATGTW